MGWWPLKDGSLTGDGPLDAAEEYLCSMVKEYQSDQNRKPTLSELLKPLALILENRADEFASACDDISVINVLAKTKKRPRKYRLKVGDVFAIPLGDGKYAFGRLTPQDGFAEFFDIISDSKPSMEQLLACRCFRLPTMLPEGPIELFRWRIIGNVPYDAGKFIPQPFRIGNQITCGTEINKDGFIVTSSQMRRVMPEEAEKVPEFSITGEELLIEYLKDKLQKCSG